MTNTPPTDFFSFMESEARAVAASFGVVTANELAAALMDRVSHRLNGDRIYIAKRSKARRQETHEAIRREFTGANLQEVAQRHGISPRHTRRILLERK